MTQTLPAWSTATPLASSLELLPSPRAHSRLPELSYFATNASSRPREVRFVTPKSSEEENVPASQQFPIESNVSALMRAVLVQAACRAQSSDPALSYLARKISFEATLTKFVPAKSAAPVKNPPR